MTEAGERLLDELDEKAEWRLPDGHLAIQRDLAGVVARYGILAIEAEAVAAALTALRAQVEGLHNTACGCLGDGADPDCYSPQAAVLALIDAAMPGGKK